MPHNANDNDSADEARPLLLKGSCPICSKPRDTKYRPFCSKHCADVDLARWLGGRYAIPANPSEDEEDDEPGSLSISPRERPE